ncbi:exosome non-catalytic core subunit rrp40 [Borealophlyctis nickersoniae]|nr:exosome non-catalytic core subunit rrp40 [Borealophlyctis nickersoniae]
MTTSETIPQIVFPGVRVPYSTGDSDSSNAKVRLGPGLHQENGELTAVKAGALRTGKGNRLWVEGSQKRYVPAVNEPVLGIVTARHAESFRVDIGSAHQASLGALAFEGANKRNRPNLEVGSLVYARVTVANKDMEPELDCINPSTGKGDGYGELKGGFMIKVSLGLARSLINPQNELFKLLSEALAFETAIGLNGRVWINAGSIRNIVGVANMLRSADGAAPSKIPGIVKAHLKQMDGDAMDES